MNIAILFDGMLEQGVGSLVSTLRFAERLKRRGHKIIFISAKYPGRPKVDDYMGFKVYRFASLMVPKTEKKFYICFPMSEELVSIFKKEKIDILHLMLATPAAISAVKAAKKLGIKIVAHSHTQPENILLAAPKLLQREKVISLIYRYIIWLYRKADVIVCPSKFAEDVLKKYDSKLNTVVISNGVDHAVFKKKRPNGFFKKFGLSNNKKKILFVGRVAPEKNIGAVIKAMPAILKTENNIEFLIIGGGYLHNNLKKLARRLYVEDHVKFLGRVSNEDVINAYNSCDMFILPSYAELEGMVVLEAMSCGMPILIANSDSSASVDFVDGNGFLFNPNDPKDLAEKVVKLCHDNALRKKMGLRSFKKSKNYEINKSIIMLEKAYRSVCRSRD